MRILAFFLGLLAASAANAHELWIEPLDYTVAPDASIQAAIVNGQDFAGGEVAYFPQRIARFDLILGETTVAVTGRMGDRPAMTMPPLGEGLHIAVYQSSGDLLTYDSYAIFARFVEHKAFPRWIHRIHRDRGWPEVGFGEFYTRYSKALIAVGRGEGADQRLGLETELVALDNPYVGAPTEIRVQAFYQDTPRAAAQIELFDKAPDGTVVVTYHSTDADGIAALPVTSGHSYLVDAVVLREAAPEVTAPNGAVWESLWAALTFAVP